MAVRQGRFRRSVDRRGGGSTIAPQPTLLVRKDVWAGLLLAAFGVAGLALGADLPLGSAGRMGPGYFPRGLSFVLIVFGAIVALRALAPGSEAVERMRLRPLLGIVAGGVAFAWLIDEGGILLASVAAIAGGGLADRESRWGEVAVLAVISAGFCAAVFVWALRLPIPLWFR
ncbi:MAG: tripartite tricarboxylate transporter TctB family protein [Alphaproteobacteria bacterium]|nr:tripartite tricarboxylate transporter TctB family protein [Alphaproteobacteria bacterium]